MRILVVAPGPSYSVADVQRGWEKALTKLGHEVRTYNLDDRMSVFGAAQFGPDLISMEPDDVFRLATEPIGNACYRFWPDLIFVISGFFVPDYLWELWGARKWHKTVLLLTECPYEDAEQFDKVTRWQPDVLLLNDPVNADAYSKIHDCIGYAPHAYDPDIHFPAQFTRYESDFAFVGTGYPSRRDFLARVDWRGIDVRLAGNFRSIAGTVLEQYLVHPFMECFENADAADLYRSCKVSANLYRGARDHTSEANHPSLIEGWAVGPREIELAATNTFFLREPRGEGDELFPMLPTFTDAGEFGDLLRYYLAHDDKREDAANRAREAIVDRTFDAHARQLMQVLPD